MNTTCGCFPSIAAASVVPVKRYNQLVPAIFPRSDVPLEGETDPAVLRQIKKLLEYVQKNPERGPKVSRRLARRLEKAMSRRQWGVALLVARTYSSLLEGLPPTDAPLLAWELVAARVRKASPRGVDPLPPGGAAAGARESVVGRLLASQRSDLRTAGARLVAAFAATQDDSDYLSQLDSFAAQLCSFTGGPASLAASKAVGAGGDPRLEELTAACFDALGAVDALAARISMPFVSQPQVAAAVAQYFAKNEERDAGAGRAVAVDVLAGAGGDTSAVKQSGTPRAAAERLLTGFGQRTETVLGARQRLGILFAAMAQAGLWTNSGGGGGGGARAALEALRRGLLQQHQLLVAYLALDRHAKTLPPDQQQTASQAAAEFRAALDGPYAIAADAQTSLVDASGDTASAPAGGGPAASAKTASTADSREVRAVPAGSDETDMPRPSVNAWDADASAALGIGNDTARGGDAAEIVGSEPQQAAALADETACVQTANKTPGVLAEGGINGEGVLTIDEWLAARGIPAMNPNPPACLFGEAAA